MLALSPDDPGRSRHVVVENRYLEGDLDRATLGLAFSDVARRHDGLRLVFDAVGPNPRVRIEERVEPRVEYLDLSALSEGTRRTAVEELAHRENQRCFDLREGPLWHAWVVRLDATTHLLNACFSHVIADGWCPKVFVEDLLGSYGARLGLAPPPPCEPLSFAEVHALQSRRLEPRSERLRYWREHLLPLPRDTHAVSHLRARPDADLMARATLAFGFPPGTVEELKRVAWRARTTPFLVLMAGYHLLLCCLGGGDRSVINSAMGIRSTERARRTILQFAVDPYVHTEAPGDASLRSVIRATTKAMEAAGENAVSYGSLARAVNPGFDSERPWAAYHLCDGAFIEAAFFSFRETLSGLDVRQVFLPGAPPPNHAPELVVSRLTDPVAPAWAARCGPGILIFPGRSGGMVRYNPQVHPPESMQELVDQYLWIVEALAREPDLAVDALRERHRRRF